MLMMLYGALSSLVLYQQKLIVKQWKQLCEQKQRHSEAPKTSLHGGFVQANTELQTWANKLDLRDEIMNPDYRFLTHLN